MSITVEYAREGQTKINLTGWHFDLPDSLPSDFKTFLTDMAELGARVMYDQIVEDVTYNACLYVDDDDGPEILLTLLEDEAVVAVPLTDIDIDDLTVAEIDTIIAIFAARREKLLVEEATIREASTFIDRMAKDD